jgi:drug/metabolite transporter (DMT)-like permease
VNAGAAARRPLLGVGLMLLAALNFATLDTITRHLSQHLALPVLLWSRYGVQALLMAVWVAVRSGPAGLRTAHPRFQVSRGLLLLVSSAMAFTALQHMPVPEFTAIVMLTPVLVALLARWVLHERLSRLRWALVAGAFLGALVVIRPGAGLFGWVALFPMATALSNAAFQLLSSRMAGMESPTTTNFYTGLVGLVAMTPVLWFSSADLLPTLQAASRADLVWLVLLGGFGTAGHLCLIMALGQAPAATLMPYIYAQIAFAAAVAWLAFRHVPDAWAWLGMGIITVCGAASAWLNLSRAPRPVSAVTADTVGD